MGLAEIVQLLRDSIGLDPDSIGRSTVERAISDRQAATCTPDIAAYYLRVRTSPEELQALIELVVVPETWFFRDPGAFDALSSVVRHGAVPMATEPLRLLSVPSSTGEEPYSMAMALLDAGVPSARFQIEAMDISARALEHAAAAVYGRNSFRGTGTLGREQHFEPTPPGRRVAERVRRQVRFRQGNLLACPFVPGRDRFDIVFCRNLLIYFDRATQDRAIETLGALLKPEGLLFVGSSEGGLALNHSFVSAKLPMAFAFRRPVQARSERKKPAQTKARARLKLHAVPHALTSVVDRGDAEPARPLAVPDLAEIRAIVDEGRLAEAAALCERHIERLGPSADAFCLLGVVREATGQSDEAAVCYRKALYLEPSHADAVTHLALLVERQGHVAEAKVLWTRARRLAGGAAR
jgi:chemotaxis protein methyltransferase WspC